MLIKPKIKSFLSYSSRGELHARQEFQDNNAGKAWRMWECRETQHGKEKGDGGDSRSWKNPFLFSFHSLFIQCLVLGLCLREVAAIKIFQIPMI